VPVTRKTLETLKHPPTKPVLAEEIMEPKYPESATDIRFPFSKLSAIEQVETRHLFVTETAPPEKHAFPPTLTEPEKSLSRTDKLESIRTSSRTHTVELLEIGPNTAKLLPITTGPRTDADSSPYNGPVSRPV
jgi:hypothetical protein